MADEATKIGSKDPDEEVIEVTVGDEIEIRVDRRRLSSPTRVKDDSTTEGKVSEGSQRVLYTSKPPGGGRQSSSSSVTKLSGKGSGSHTPAKMTTKRAWSPIAGPLGRNIGTVGITKETIIADKVPTIYIVGGQRSKRLAAHARQKLPDPCVSDSPRAYDVAEVGDPVVHPVRETRDDMASHYEGLLSA